MKRKIIKSGVSILLVLAMVMSLCLTAVAAEMELTWYGSDPDAWPEGTPPQWALDATEEEQNATLAAISSEYDNQRAAGFDMGEFASFGAWGDMVIAQFEGGDNTGNPWGQANRKLGAIIAPYAGMAFALKAQFAEKIGPSTVPLSNQITWTNPMSKQTNIYQVYMNGETVLNSNGSYNAGWGYCPGSTVSNSIAQVFKYTYASSAWYNEAVGKPVNLGCIHSNATVSDEGYVYQEFFGNDSTGAAGNHNWDTAYGISYIVAQSEMASEAFVVTGDMMTAWASTWDYTDSANPDRFAVTGAPIGNQYVDNNGVVCQEFENCTIMLDGEDPRHPTVSSSGTEILEFKVGSNFAYICGEIIQVYLNDTSSDITALAPEFTLSENAVCDRKSGEAMDFSEPVEYTVTAEDGGETVYTVVVETATEVTEEELAACEQFKLTHEFVGEDVSFYDTGVIMGMEIAYNMLPVKLKYLLADEVEYIKSLVESVEAMYEEPIKIAFVGDSITDPGVNAQNYAIQVGEDLFGLPFDVKNFGASGFCLSPASDWAYTTTDKYRKSLEFQPDIVFILLGTNDSKYRNWNDRNVKSRFKADLENMVNTYKNLDSHPTVVIGTSPTVYGEKIDTINNANVTEIAAIQRQVAEEMGCPLVEINEFTANHEDWFGDGVHPNVTGHTNMKTLYLEYLESLANVSLTGITVDGEAVADFNPDVPAYYVYTEDMSKLDELDLQCTASNSSNIVKTVDAEKGICKITVKAGLKYFDRTYVIFFTDVPFAVPGDIDGKNGIDVNDLSALKALIMSHSADEEWDAATLAVGDLDASGDIDVNDLSSLKALIMAQ